LAAWQNIEFIDYNGPVVLAKGRFAATLIEHRGELESGS
jgi:hypothetical protein